MEASDVLAPRQLALVTALRAALHACPEPAGQERRTKALLMDFLRANTSLTLVDRGSWFYAAHRETQNRAPAPGPHAGCQPGQPGQPGGQPGPHAGCQPGQPGGIALRADFDALPTPGGAAHLCGHDGHAAALCGTALLLEGRTVGRDVFLLFQPAEETGQGAKGCLPLLAEEPVAEIYGAHNLPGLPLGLVTTRAGTFACGSHGVTLRFAGTPAHAASPAEGRSPAPALGALLYGLPELTAPERFAGFTLCTAVGCRMGQKAFGSAAADAELWLTLRADTDDGLSALHTAILRRARSLAAAQKLSFSATVQDDFPATVNDAAAAARVLALCGGQPLAAPMRWSEDFGWYLRQCRGAFFGIGAGEHCPALHTAAYQYPDALLAPTAAAFRRLIGG